jgi:hypothetical protein
MTMTFTDFDPITGYRLEHVLDADANDEGFPTNSSTPEDHEPLLMSPEQPDDDALTPSDDPHAGIDDSSLIVDANSGNLTMGGEPNGAKIAYEERKGGGFPTYTREHHLWSLGALDLAQAGMQNYEPDPLWGRSQGPKRNWGSRWYYYVHSEIHGSSQDNVIHGHGQWLMHNNDHQHNEHDYRMGDRIDGKSGNDAIFGHDGNDILQGGAGHDVLVAGSGSDTLNGGADNDWLIVDQRIDSDGNTLTGGGGSDTFVLAPMNGNGWVDFDPGSQAGSSFAGNVAGGMSFLESLIGHAEKLAPFSQALKVGSSLINLFNPSGTKPPSLTLNWPNPDTITDFNPFEDSLMINYDPSKAIEIARNNGGNGFVVRQEANGISTYLANVNFDLNALQNYHGLYGAQLDDLDTLAFETLQNTMIAMSGAQKGAYLAGSRTSIPGSDGIAEKLGHGGMLLLGAYGAAPITLTNRTQNTNRITGTSFGDVINAYDMTKSANNPDMRAHRVFGFGGDDIIKAGGARNEIYGGAGSDWVSYDYDASVMNGDWQGINADLMTGYINNGIRQSGVSLGENADRDTVKEVENIVGSRLDDVIRGDNNNNIFISGQGKDVLAGCGGNDTFILNGGENTIEDYASGDVIKIVADAYNSDQGSDFHLTDGRNNGSMEVRVLRGDGSIEVAARLNGVLHDDSIHQIDIIDADQNLLRRWAPGQGSRLDSTSLSSDDQGGVDLITGFADKDVWADPISGTQGNDVLVGTKGADTFLYSAGSDLIEGFSLEQGDVFAIDADTTYTIGQVGNNAQLVTEFGTTTFEGVSAELLLSQQSVVVI